jgi:sporulation protein YlmC with PRC-barrel domain
MADDRGRVLHAGLQLLDRQLVDRRGVLCGKVDDLELEPSEDGRTWYVTAIVTGPGALMVRSGHRRLGGWLRHFARTFVSGSEADPGRVPFRAVRTVGDEVVLSIDAEDLATHGGERWVRDHVIRRIPGSGHDPDQ